MRIKQCGRIALKIVLCVSIALFLIGTCAVAIGGVFLKRNVDISLGETLQLRKGEDRTTRLYYYDENGRAIELSADRLSGYENALWCPLEEIGENLQNAFIAIEDKRFYSHGGIDWARTAAAVLDYCRGGMGHFGGSTITQQLVKNVTGETERSAKRKITELLRAVKIEEEYSKEEILEQYLNVVNLAGNCYGVRTAANAYFSKEPSELTLREAATIAAITNNPAKYDPIRNPSQNRERRDVILSQMHEQGMIGDKEYHDAVSKETVLNVDQRAFAGRVNSYYADMVANDVIRALVTRRGMSERAASRLVYSGGLKIYTAMDFKVQQIVDEYYGDPDHFPTHRNGEKAQSALMITDPHTGDILAVAGAIGEKKSNRVQNFACDTKRPTGSVIKPLSIYAPALARGLVNYATVFDDVPHTFKENGDPWPKNAPRLYRGLTTVNTAVRQSVNTVCVSVLERLGNEASFRFLADGLEFVSLDEKNDKGTASLALGQQYNGVTLREVVGGYTALANGGVFEGTRSFYKVLDSSGHLLLENAPLHKRVMEEADAAILTLMLRGVVQNGTAASLKLKNVVDVAGKTGTTGKNCDKWFVGYTPNFLCGVWYGHEYPVSLYDVKGNPAMQIFDEIMAKVVTDTGEKEERFSVPNNVIAVRYCKDSGCLPTAECLLDPRGERIEYGFFKKGTEPHSYCHCHVSVDYCEEGGVATKYCPVESCKKVALLRVKREFPRQIKVEDAPYTFDGYLVDKERYFSSNEPYYAQNDDSKKNYGVGMKIIPYNRVCPVHTGEDFWDRRSDIKTE